MDQNDVFNRTDKVGRIRANVSAPAASGGCTEAAGVRCGSRGSGGFGPREPAGDNDRPLPLAAIFTRLLRGDMVQTLQQDFITLASAKGVPPRRVLWVHGLRNSLFSLVTAVGTQLGAIVGGAIVAETFFDLDGMGSMLVTAILSKDLFTVQSAAAILVATVVTMNLIVDLLYAVIDPRIRHARALA